MTQPNPPPSAAEMVEKAKIPCLFCAFRGTLAELKEHSAMCLGHPLADHPENDCTDFAHPAWWRGHEHTAKVFCQYVSEILDGKEISGVSYEPWESTRRRIADLRSNLEIEMNDGHGEILSVRVWIMPDWSIIAPDLPDCGSQGRDMKSCCENFMEAFIGVVQSYRADGKEIPWIPLEQREQKPLFYEERRLSIVVAEVKS